MPCRSSSVGGVIISAAPAAISDSVSMSSFLKKERSLFNISEE